MQKFLNNVYKHPVDLGDYRKTILLAGVGRSGTTWVGDLINYRNQYRVMFEPFRADKIPVLSHFEPIQYLRAENRDQNYLLPAKTILSGNVKNDWIDRYNTKIIARRRLIKDIRVNLMLKWIKTNFAEIPILLLFRHPCAVAASRMKLGWEPNPRRYLQQKDLVDDFLAPFCSLIENTTDIFEKHILAWCIQSFVPLKQLKREDALVLFYENMCDQPEIELKRIFDFIGEPFTSNIMDAFRKPSALARKDSTIVSGGNLITSWQKNVTLRELERTTEILSAFGQDNIYGTGPMPLIDSTLLLQK